MSVCRALNTPKPASSMTAGRRVDAHLADIKNGRAVRDEYDAEGRRSARVLPDGERTNYQHDIERDGLGRERTRRAAGVTLETDYDVMDRLLSQRVSSQSAPDPGAGVPKILAQRRYGYDGKGRLTSIESARGGLTTYQYDSIDQLIEASQSGAREVFQYDPTGSLVKAIRGLEEVGGLPGPWSMRPGNQLVATERDRYVNDRRGRRIKRIERVDGREEKTIYGWDTKDRLREIVQDDGTRIRFTYDAFGRRVRKDVLGPTPNLMEVLDGRAAPVSRRTVEFLWDGDVLCEERDSRKEAGTEKRVHVHEPGTFVPMLQVERGEAFVVVNDHLGMPKELIDSAGRVAWRATHGAWGDVRGVERDRGAAEVESPFRLLGQYADRETGLCYTRFRYFEAATGRWLSADPLGIAGGRNLQAFDGNPTWLTDPLGLACIIYGPLDAQGRPTGVVATIDSSMLNTGTDAARRIKPAGFALGDTRGHLLGKQLGGDGRTRENLVTMKPKANNVEMSSVEDQVAAAVRAGETITYMVTPIYDGNNPVPRGVTIEAEGSGGTRIHTTVINNE
jgi:RHS repeat-associated protein